MKNAFVPLVHIVLEGQRPTEGIAAGSSPRFRANSVRVSLEALDDRIQPVEDNTSRLIVAAPRSPAVGRGRKKKWGWSTEVAIRGLVRNRRFHRTARLFFENGDRICHFPQKT